MSGGPAVSYSWSTADQFEPSPQDANPATGSGPTFTTTYSFGGTKIVALLVCDTSACVSAQTIVSIGFAAPPKIESFNCLPDVVFRNGLVTCTASLSGVAPGGTFSWSTLGGSPQGRRRVR